jgi:hypothetical protein
MWLQRSLQASRDFGLGLCAWLEEPRLRRPDAHAVLRGEPPSLDPAPAALPPPIPPVSHGPVSHGPPIHGLTPECAAERAGEGADQTPPAARKRAHRTPKPPRRALHWYEVPDERFTADYIVHDLACDADGEKLLDPALNDHEPIELHAFRLALAIAEPQNAVALEDPPIASGKVKRGLFAYQIEQMYLHMCGMRLWWKPHRWGGTNGVAQHLRQLLYGRSGGPLPGGRLPYKYLINPDGSVARKEFYPLPKRTLAFGPRLVKPRPKRTPSKPSTGLRKRPGKGAPKIKRAA